jgi:hypothetical protein
MAYYRKTRDEFQIHQWWGQWEEVCAEDTRREAMARLKEYRANQPGVACKVVKRRVPLTLYRVSLPRNRWKRGFKTLEEARAYAAQVQQCTGVIVAVEVDA